MSQSALYAIAVEDIRGQRRTMAEFQGKVLLIVNTASKCGFTPQFEGLQDLYRELRDDGLEVLGFPCNQFLNQDPGDNDAISQFCSVNYGVDFPMFAKVEVNGPASHPLFALLRSRARGLMGSEKIKWNFTKFLVDRQGTVVRRYPPTTKPGAIREDILALL